MNNPTEGTRGHTPGPWIVERGTDYLWIGQGKADGRPKVGEIVVSLDYAPGYRPEFYAKQDANATLFAAAPELLEELEQQADGCATIIGLLDGQKSATAASLVAMLKFQEANARAAITKATASPDTGVGG